ncbi:ATP-dependent Clp protease proteolytic subunit [Corynebacterium provencense]|uniref:ATP-dependent Clp protease proteolytic subunit n=1 Tax=Corynebacterium provencense TaxID=1737425 RepID=A0A2Z3YPB0_9CORY|nr:head maturation protease, ClpP-related [Corynebacterium provencense]AWT27315.1 ATP-dependent Clp protease proteolytic subunit [Corynebacterium provencense]
MDINLNGDISPTGCGANWLRSQLPAPDEPVTLRVNSGGGDVYEAITMVNILRAHPGPVTAIVEGLAASAASYLIAGAAEKVTMRPGAEIMVHRPWTALEGDGPALVKAAGDLERLGTTLARTYATKAGGTEAQWNEYMAEETWFSADEAVASGLADDVLDARPAAHVARTPIMAHYKYRSRAQAPTPDLKENPVGPDTTTPEHTTAPAFTDEQWTKFCQLLDLEPDSTIDQALDLLAATVDKLSTDDPATDTSGTPLARSRRVLLDRTTYTELISASREGIQIRAEREAKAREDEVDRWIQENRIGHATRARAVAMAHRDMQAARDLFGAIPAGTVHREEIGHAQSIDAHAQGDNPTWVR